MSMEEKLKSLCQDRCSAFGEPPCYEIVKDEPSLGEWTPCRDCRAEAGLPPEGDPIDPAAVIRPLL